jgi:pyroglutamyl-peptidase
MKVLITGFEPFDREKINPSYEIVKSLPLTVGKAEIIKKEVPVVYGKSIESVVEEIEKTFPDIVIMLGQAGGRTSITVERVAINVNDSNTPDNSKNILKGEVIVKNGPVGYFSTLPIYQIVKGLTRAKIPASISNTAGTFVCNSLFYGVMHEISQRKRNIMAGFIHVPYLPVQTLKKPNTPSMSFDYMLRGIKTAITISVKERSKLKGMRE